MNPDAVGSREFQPTAEFSQALLTWYQAAKRDLPWRRCQDDAYAVWISEIMLQQTTVRAVVGYYERWMERFPDVTALAAAPLDNVLRCWAGLGYYSRARNIKRAAELIVLQYSGSLPQTVGGLSALPGIGRYTAGAIASIAFNQDAPILDANVVRVLCRVAAITAEDVKTTPVQSRLWSLAEQAIPRGSARDFNQAMMELGALVCTPLAPRCPVCPVSNWCGAYKSGEPERFPAAPKAKQWRTARHVAVAIEARGRLLIVKRAEDSVHWAGLWEMPRVAAADGESLEEAACRAGYEVAGLDVQIERSFSTIKHVVTNTKITLTGFAAFPRSLTEAKELEGENIAWISADDLRGYAVASPHLKLITSWFAGQRQAVLAL